VHSAAVREPSRLALPGNRRSLGPTPNHLNEDSHSIGRPEGHALISIDRPCHPLGTCTSVVDRACVRLVNVCTIEFVSYSSIDDVSTGRLVAVGASVISGMDVTLRARRVTLK
jgi:hypothetical protein